MFKKILLVILLFPALAFSCSEGKKLANQFWKDTLERHFKKLAASITYDYQCLSSHGALTKKQDLQALEKSPFTNYIITNVRTTKPDGRLVVTYDLEIIAPSGNYFYHELFAYRKHEGHWKLFASSFIPFSPV